MVAAAGEGGLDAPRPLAGIMHAGAVLDSKVLSNVTIKSIRTEYSGGNAQIGAVDAVALILRAR